MTADPDPVLVARFKGFPNNSLSGFYADEAALIAADLIAEERTRTREVIAARLVGALAPFDGGPSTAVEGLRAALAVVDGAADQIAKWPEWLSPEYTAMHTAISNEIVRALAHCYESADAAGMNWTLDGFVSCSASNILSRLKRDGAPPIPSHETEHLSAEALEREWEQEDSEDEDEEQTHVLQEGP